MAEPARWVIEPLSKGHVRSAFDCGEPALDEFLRRYARQNQEKGLSRTFVAVGEGEKRVLGYFTLSAGSVERTDLPEEERRRLPGYPVPVVHLGRLAVDASAQGEGLGAALLVNALRRSLRAAEIVGAHAVEVVAKTGAAKAFYEKHGFRALEDDRLHLYLPMTTLRRVFGRGAR